MSKKFDSRSASGDTDVSPIATVCAFPPLQSKGFHPDEDIRAYLKMVRIFLRRFPSGTPKNSKDFHFSSPYSSHYNLLSVPNPDKPGLNWDFTAKHTKGAKNEFLNSVMISF